MDGNINKKTSSITEKTFVMLMVKENLEIAYGKVKSFTPEFVFLKLAFRSYQ